MRCTHADIRRTTDGHCRECVSERVAAARKATKTKLVELHGGECLKCGYNKCQQALVFHHRDPSTKEFGIGGRGHTRAWSKLVTEAAKCDLLCSNCHAEVHSMETGVKATRPAVTG